MLVLDEHDASVRDEAAKALVKIGYEVLPPKWPQYSAEVFGHNVVRVNNPNEFKVRVGLRSRDGGKDFMVPAHGTGLANVPNGSYEVYFQYSTDPLGLYQGDRLMLNNSAVEVQIVRVVDGNYGIRRV